MIVWEWENLGYFFNPTTLAITDAGPLLSPVQTFSIKRDEAGQLVLETVSIEQERNGYDSVPGTVHTVTETVKFEGGLGRPYHAVANGVIPYEYTTRHQSSGATETTETSLVQSIEGVYRKDVAVAFTLEWIENIDQSGSIWTGASITTIETISKRRTLKAATDTLELIASDEAKSVNNCGLKLAIGGTELYICTIARPGEDKSYKKTGFIAYIGDIPKNKRQKIRDVLSFCLGNYLSYVGHIALDKACQPVRVEASSTKRLGFATSQVPSLPPAPLWVRYRNEIHQDIVGRMANAIFDKYEELRFEELSWAYWHAACAPAHMAAAHYGAALEALRRACTESRKLRTTLIPKRSWQLLKIQLLSHLSDFELDDTTRQIFSNKISGLNHRPQDMIVNDVLASMGLPAGKLERNAWKRRHQAAHGSSLKEEELTTTIRETKLLRVLFHRMILAATGASDRYIDYYSINFPIRNLSEPIPEN